MFTKQTKKRVYDCLEICEHGRSCRRCCFEWVEADSETETGFGFLRVEEFSKPVSLHRLCWMLHYEILLPSQIPLYHTICHNSACCNPHHISLTKSKKQREVEHCLRYIFQNIKFFLES